MTELEWALWPLKLESCEAEHYMTQPVSPLKLLLTTPSIFSSNLSSNIVHFPQTVTRHPEKPLIFWNSNLLAPKISYLESLSFQLPIGALYSKILLAVSVIFIRFIKFFLSQVKIFSETLKFFSLSDRHTKHLFISRKAIILKSASHWQENGKIWNDDLLVVAQLPSDVWLCDPMDCSTPGFPGLHYIMEFAETHVHWISDAIQPSQPPLLLLPSIFLSVRVFSNESTLHIRWPKYWSFSFSLSPSNEYSGLISFRIQWFDLLAVQGTAKSLMMTNTSH